MDRLDRIEKNLAEITERQLKAAQEIAESHAKFEKQMEESRAKAEKEWADIRAAQARTDAQLAKTDAKLKETAQILSNIGINLGHTAEEFFYHSLKEKPFLGNIRFEEVETNLKGHSKKVQDEFDIVLFNGDCVGLVEVKHKVHPNDIAKLYTQKVENFRALFPDYKDYKIYLGIGGMSIPEEVEAEAKSEGIAVLRQAGNLAEIEAEHLKAY